jgi:energy-coupling factor transporter ATP-binding protein EcfA2
MYLQSIQIQNLRSVSRFVWHAPPARAGWHVIIGDNGSGKSTVLRAIALAIVGPAEATALRQDWNDWLREGDRFGFVRLILDHDRKFDKFSGKGRTPENFYLSLRLFLRREKGSVTLYERPEQFNPKRHVWGGKSGWFCASYGPFRRFTGGDKDYEKMFYAYPRLARHLSLFGESIALTESLAWLKELDYKKSKNYPEGGFLDSVRAFINNASFLPNNTRLAEISPEGVIFRDGDGCRVRIENLSDGYRSVLSMTLELLRQLYREFEPGKIFDSKRPETVIVPGVVLIDEPDAHLHPRWQRRIGTWFQETFPKMQFLVATHSPLICQAAEKGSIYRLPRLGSEESGGFIEGEERNRLVYGNVLDAYSTEAFGPDVERSETSKEKLKRLAQLNRKELKRGLTDKEKREQDSLRAMMPTTAHFEAKTLEDVSQP